jgi:hypothetical protein
MTSSHTAEIYEIRFISLFREGRGFGFPCDVHGHVNMDLLSDRAKENYLFARAMIGREFSYPTVMALH